MSDNASYKKGVDNDWRNLLYTELNRTGGDPSVLFEILEGIIEQRAWENLLDDNGQPIGSLKRLIEAPLPVGCGQNVNKIISLLRVEHRYEKRNKEWHKRMQKLRHAIEAELNIEREKKLAKLSRTSRDYRIAQLKEKAPEIAEAILKGEIDAAQGMRQLRAREGKRERNQKFTIPMQSPELTLKALTHHMETDNLYELIELLLDWQAENETKKAPSK